MAKKKKVRKSTSSPNGGPGNEVLAELTEIKKLVVLLLAKLGSGSAEIADALDRAPSGVRNWLSFNKVVKIAEKDDE